MSPAIKACGVEGLADPSLLADPVTITVTEAFFDEMRPWHEDAAFVYNANITYEVKNSRKVVLTLERDQALDLLDFSQYGADGFSSGGGRDAGSPIVNARYARMYKCAAQSLQKQLNTKGRLPQ